LKSDIFFQFWYSSSTISLIFLNVLLCCNRFFYGFKITSIFSDLDESGEKSPPTLRLLQEPPNHRDLFFFGQYFRDLGRKFSQKGSYPPIALYNSYLVTFFLGPLKKNLIKIWGVNPPLLSTFIKCGNYFVEKWKVTFLCVT
jgi:hypothetical protein